MNELLKQLGIIIMLIGVAIVVYVVGKGVQSNALLLWSLIIILLGLVVYMVTNHLIE